jgi:hypothetical protein
MKISCTVVLDFTDTESARMISHATKIDNMDFVKTKIKGKQIIATITSSSVSSMLHTLDDYLACVSVAETVGE